MADFLFARNILFLYNYLENFFGGKAMNFLDKMKSMAKQNKKTIVLPETSDVRTLKAAEIILAENIADLILIGKQENFSDYNLSTAKFIEQKDDELLNDLSNKFYELRKNKGMTPEKAHEILLNDSLYFSVMLVKDGLADGMVAGAINSTANVLRPSLQILKTAPSAKLVSAIFVMVTPTTQFGYDGTLIFADCAINQNPSALELSEIAKSSAESFRNLIGGEPIVAMLSHSTKGSAKHSDVDKVIEATNLVKASNPDFLIDGELQLDAAIVDSVAQIKAKDSDVAGKANVLIFPDLDAGNIGYKLVQRFSGAQAFGPITQGIAKPVNDLSRGCSAEDIVGVVAITCVQAQKN